MDVIAGEMVFIGEAPAGKGACKKGGWADLERVDGSTFKNQGVH